MITNIKLNGKYSIGVNGANQICVKNRNNEDVTLNLKDIPFVRYNLGSYNLEELGYIQGMMNTFKLSTHLLQFNAGVNLLNDLENVTPLANTVARYIYIELEQSDFLAGQVKPELLAPTLQAYQSYSIDRIMLIDKTQNMDMANAKKILNDTARKLNIPIDKIGICSSPLCMNQELACLTALKARELASMYSNNTEVALPSANHQDMNCCGCMRYIDINSDCIAPVDGKAKKATVKKSDDTESSVPKAPKKTKATTPNSLSFYC